MGAWGHRAFDNDDALDWVAELGERSDFYSINVALNAIIRGGGDYLEAPRCCKALAAAEIVAALRGRPADDLRVEVSSWIKGKRVPEASLVQRAALAVDAILRHSELNDLWAESPDFANWEAGVLDLKTRLK